MGEKISEAIGADHKAFDEYYEKIVGTADEAVKAQWRNQLTWIVARHAISEELTVYPAMERHLGDKGVQLSKIDKEQHTAVKDDLAKLQDMSPAHRDFQPLLDSLMENLHHHIEHEKTEDMPLLEDKLSREESEALARAFQKTKMISPTRSHPDAPTTFYMESLAALMAAPIDRFKDLVREFPETS